VKVNSGTPSGTMVSNTATVTATTVDPNPANNSDTEISEVQAVLPECYVTTLNLPGNAGTATLRDDADNPGTGVLVITGTSGSETIVIEPRPNNTSQIRVMRNGQQIGVFSRSAVQHIVAFGRAGDDTISVSASLSRPATFFGQQGNDVLLGGASADGLSGGDGNDRLYGGGGNDMMCGGDGNDFLYGQAGNDFVGGDAGNDQLFGDAGRDLLLGGAGSDSLRGGMGNDRLFGQAGGDWLYGDADHDIVVGGGGNDQVRGGGGRDLLIGGRGVDGLFGEADDDILVGGVTVHDNDQAALRAILAEWTSTSSYNTRAGRLRSGGGANGVYVLNGTTVTDDAVIDTLWGDGGLDWFLFSPGDKLKDRAAGERLN
jgi:Ca2+-binding RTX toxin-like protein